MSRKISESTVRRLSLYLRILEGMGDATPTVSSDQLAAETATTAAQVRKDLSLFGSFGKRGLGYSVEQLGVRLRQILGLDREWKVALVGAGRIGTALIEYPGFARRGFRIISVYDDDPERVGQRLGDLVVEPVEDLAAGVRRRCLEMLIVAVPAGAVQDVVRQAVEAGVKGVLNFAPAQIAVPPHVALKHVNMVMELEALSFSLTSRE